MTTTNRAAVLHFAGLFYRQHRVKEAFDTDVTPDYVQHSSAIADGRPAAIFRLKDHRIVEHWT